MSKRDVGRDFAAILLKHAYVGVKKIGEGSFGVAVLAEDKDAARFVCKMVNVSTASRQEAQEARKEARLLAKLKHPYIVRYRESFMDKGWLCIVMDYADGGDLTAKIEEYKAKGELIPEAQVLRWMAQGILALKYLHDKHVLHRDLKPSNLFLTGSGDLRMGDFGISKVLDSTLGCAKTFVGTPFYISPEVIMEKPYRWPADVWSMGCIVFQLCAQKVPFEAQNIRGLVQKVTKGPLPELPAPYSKELREVFNKMLIRNPEERAKVEDIIGTELFQKTVRGILAEKREKPAKTNTKEGAVLGLCFELVDGTRLGQCPGGLSDASLEAAGARWELLRDGEHILEVQGFACGLPLGKGDEQRTGSKSGADKVDDGILAANLVLCTNNGRHIDFGTSKVRGAAFGFKAPGGEQIEDVLFSRLEAGASQVCTGVAHAPLVACWSSDALVTLKGRLKSAAEAVCPVLLRLSWRVGPDHARHALLQARQLGVVVPAALAAKSEESDAGGSDSKLAAPKHWDLALMPGSGPEAWSSSGADGPKTSLPDCDIESLQVMLDTTFVDKGSKGEGQVRVKAPSGMQLVRGLRLQDWQSWAAFSAKREAIREQVRAARGAGDAEAERPRMPTDGCQSPLGAELDAETNGAWLFHLIDSNAVGRATASDFSVVEAGGQDVRSRGRGVYLADNSRAIDELAAGDVGGLRCMLLCQVTLGRSLFDREVMPDVTQLVDKCVSGTYHSVVTDHAKHWAGAYREIVVYDSEQVYPELLLWYRRIYT